MTNLNDIFGHDIYIDRELQALTAANGEYVIADDLCAATQDILLRIITPLGALFYDKEFGSTVPLYIHDESTPSNRMSLKDEIIRRVEMDSRVLSGTVTAEILKWDERQIAELGLDISLDKIRDEFYSHLDKIYKDYAALGFVPVKDYMPGRECFPLDAVNHNNTLWACIAQTTETPGPESQNWVPMLSLAASLAMDGGLGLNADKEIHVKPEAFSVPLLETLMRKMRVPIWLNRDTIWYVNGITGSDQNDGDEPDKAFKTIQAALNYVSANFNLDHFNAVIKIAPGVYNENFNVPPYAASTGTMIIEGPEDFTTNPATIKPMIVFSYGGKWSLKNINISTEGLPYDGSMICAYPLFILNAAEVTVSNVKIDGNNRIGVYQRLLVASAGGSLIIESGVSLYGDCEFAIVIETGALASLRKSMSINGKFIGSLLVSQGAAFTVAGPHYNGGKMQSISGNVIGQRYEINLNGVVYTQGAGPDFFPGTLAGKSSEGGRYL